MYCSNQAIELAVMFSVFIERRCRGSCLMMVSCISPTDGHKQLLCRPCRPHCAPACTTQKGKQQSPKHLLNNPAKDSGKFSRGCVQGRSNEQSGVQGMQQVLLQLHTLLVLRTDTVAAGTPTGSPAAAAAAAAAALFAAACAAARAAASRSSSTIFSRS